MGFRLRRSFKIAIFAAAALSFQLGSATAGQGWYLMAPPADYSQPWTISCIPDQTAHPAMCAAGVVNSFAPMSKWEQVRALDSANECEETRERLLTLAHARAAKAKKRNEEIGARVTELRMDNARCIASDDPRLTGVR